MKKLMILGGSRYILPLIKKSHELGVYVITCDYLPNNIAHKYSDEYCNVSIIEKDEVLKKAIELQIDGITSFACDPGVTTAAYVAEKMNLPSVGSYNSVCIMQNKGEFRRFLKEHGFEVPEARTYCNSNDAMSDIDIFKWPLVVKPVDSAGSKGVSKVDRPEEIEKAIENALNYSISGNFIIEDFLNPIGCPSDSDAFSVDGELRFMSFNSQLFDESAANPYTPAGFYWKPTLSKDHQIELIKEIQRLINLLELKSSVYNIEVRECNDGKAYIMECSPRGGGNRLSECLEMATGVKLIENAIRAALGMPLAGIEQKDFDGYWAEIILHSDVAGVFTGLILSEEIEEYVVEKDLWINSGDIVESFTGANETIGTIILRFEDDNIMENVMSNIRKYVQVDVKPCV